MKAKRIQLRKLKPVDLAFMMKLVKDPDTTRYIPALITDEPVMASWISQLDDSKHEYIVELKATGQAIGECSLSLMRDVAEIGIMLLPGYWNKGYGTEVIQKLQQIAETIGIHSLTALTDVRNSALIHLLNKLGYHENDNGGLVRLYETGDSDKLGDQLLVQYEKSIRSKEGRTSE